MDKRTTLPESVMETLLNKLSHIDLMIASMELEIEERKASIAKLTAEYKEISQFIGAPKKEPKNPKTKAYIDDVVNTPPPTIEDVQKEAKAKGLSYGKLQQSKKENATVKKTLKETGKWEA